MAELIKKEWIAPTHYTAAAKRLYEHKKLEARALDVKGLGLDAIGKIIGCSRFSAAKLITSEQRY